MTSTGWEAFLGEKTGPVTVVTMLSSLWKDQAPVGLLMALCQGLDQRPPAGGSSMSHLQAQSHL